MSEPSNNTRQPSCNFIRPEGNDYGEVRIFFRRLPGETDEKIMALVFQVGHAALLAAHHLLNGGSDDSTTSTTAPGS